MSALSPTTRGGGTPSPLSSPGPSGNSVVEGTESVKRKHNLTPAERQARAIEKLLADPTKEVKIPGPPKEKTLRPPREMMKNVSGSSAGAGSGEFHVYKHARRREYERIRLMEESARKKAEKEEFEKKMLEQSKLDELKTLKNRAKRDKKKKNRFKQPSTSKSKKDPSDVSEAEEGSESKKRRLVAPDVQAIDFTRPDQEGDDDDEEEEE